MATSETALHPVAPVEEAKYPVQETPQAWTRCGPRKTVGLQRPRSLVERRGEPHEPSRPDPVAAAEGAREPARRALETQERLVNRRIRNRTYGGVGAGTGDRPGYPIGGGAAFPLAEGLTALHRRNLFLPGLSKEPYDLAINMLVGPLLSLGIVQATVLCTRRLDRRDPREIGLAWGRRWLGDWLFGAALGGLLMAGVFCAEWVLGWAQVSAHPRLPRDSHRALRRVQSHEGAARGSVRGVGVERLSSSQSVGSDAPG